MNSFEHFEKLADVQMLAMLSCVFSEPAALEGVSNALTGIRQQVSGFLEFISPLLAAGGRLKLDYLYFASGIRVCVFVVRGFPCLPKPPFKKRVVDAVINDVR
jgi:hypothetical protein